MAKKNLHSLMSGIIGSDTTSSPENNPIAPQHSAEYVSPKSESHNSQLTTHNSQRGPGRPKKADGNDDIRATFIISAELLRKIKYISLMEDAMQKDVVGEALSLYVSKWEQDNGKIKLPKK